jgi:hypothetical protein
MTIESSAVDLARHGSAELAVLINGVAGIGSQERARRVDQPATRALTWSAWGWRSSSRIFSAIFQVIWASAWFPAASWMSARWLSAPASWNLSPIVRYRSRDLV